MAAPSPQQMNAAFCRRFHLNGAIVVAPLTLIMMGGSTQRSFKIPYKRRRSTARNDLTGSAYSNDLIRSFRRAIVHIFFG